MPAYLYPDSTSDQFLTKTGVQTITGAKTFEAPETLFRNPAGNTVLRIEADPGNLNTVESENWQPRLIFSQDGRLVNTRIGNVDNTNDFEIMAEFAANMNFGTGNAVRMTLNSAGTLYFPGGTVQSDAFLGVRRGGNSIEFGHGNQAGYASVLGAENGSGAPTVVFAGEHGTTSNTYTSRGFRSMVLRYSPSTTPYLAIGSVADPNLANQTLGEVWRIDTRGYMDIGARGHIGRVSLYAGHPSEKALVIRGEASQTGNLTEWQDSAGNVSARVDANGGFFALAFNNGNNPWNTVREVSTDFNTQRRSGFYDMNNCTNAPTTDAWHHLIQITHGNGNNFMYQIVFTLSTQNNTMYTRQCTNGTWHAWRAI